MNEMQPTLLSLDPPARAFDALAEYFERVYDVLPMTRKGQLHLRARTSPFIASFAERGWALGRMVLARAASDTVVPENHALIREARRCTTRSRRLFSLSLKVSRCRHVDQHGRGNTTVLSSSSLSATAKY